MSSTSPGAQLGPEHPQVRRAAGLRRAGFVTGWTAAGGTALAVLFGVVFAGAAPSATAGTAGLDTASGPDATQQAAPSALPSETATPAPVTGTPKPSSAPTATPHRRLSPPSQAPQPAAPSTNRRHASTGAS